MGKNGPKNTPYIYMAQKGILIVNKHMKNVQLSVIKEIQFNVMIILAKK